MAPELVDGIGDGIWGRVQDSISLEFKAQSLKIFRIFTTLNIVAASKVTLYYKTNNL